MSLYEPIRIFDPEGTIGLDLDRTGYLIREVAGKSVLHVGCADYPITEQRISEGTLLHEHLAGSAASILGVDLSSEGIEILRRHGFADVELMDAEQLMLTDRYDLIVAGDIIEHMSNPGRFFAQVGGLLKPGGEMIIGVPNAYSFNIVKYVLTGREPTHKDHTFFFSPKTLAQLCARFDLLPVKLCFTTQPKGRHESMPFIALRSVLLRAARRLAPSFIMHFRPRQTVDLGSYYEWV
jgi:2-polyprenyl-3-methyl-5-hydroxy-6-metoxy-1,4-benzoquinol methylase